MRKHAFGLFPVLGLLSLTLPSPMAFALQPPGALVVPAQPAIVTTGAGEVTVVPNLATMMVGVDTRDYDSTKAASLNAGKMEQVMKVIRALGVAENDIQTVSYSLTPYSVGDAKNPRQLYQVNNTVRVTIRRLNDTGKLVDAVTQIGGNLASGPQFDADEVTKSRAYEQALTQATAAALRKAQTMAKASGSTLTALLELTESSSESNPPRPMMTYAKTDAATPISGGELTVRASVTARYAITGLTNVGLNDPIAPRAK